MAGVERSLPTALAELPVLTLFGRKDDPYGWQARFGQIFPRATAAAIDERAPFPVRRRPGHLQHRDLRLVGAEGRGPWQSRHFLKESAR